MIKNSLMIRAMLVKVLITGIVPIYDAGAEKIRVKGEYFEFQI